MSWELVYTSVPQGLKPGSRGFCAVAQTRGISTTLLERLESLSGYRHLFAPQDPNARLNPPAWSHLIVTVSGKRFHLLSYVGDAGLDYSQRTNKLAHHVACEPNELTPTGPAGSLQQPGFLLTKWQSEPAQWPTGRALPRGEIRPGLCANWQRLAGDAGWAGILAETIYNRREVNVIFQPGMPILNLFAEAIALLPPQKRWEATFQTFYTGLPQGVDCRWRGIVAGSEEEAVARRNTNALLIDLAHPKAAPASVAAAAAREGRVVEPLRTLEPSPTAARPTAAPQTTLASQPITPPRGRAGYPAAPQPDMNSYELQPLDGVNNGPPSLAPNWDPRYAQRVNRGNTWLIVGAVVGLIVVLGTAGGAYWLVNQNKQATATQEKSDPNKGSAPPKGTGNSGNGKTEDAGKSDGQQEPTPPPPPQKDDPRIAELKTKWKQVEPEITKYQAQIQETQNNVEKCKDLERKINGDIKQQLAAAQEYKTSLDELIESIKKLSPLIFDHKTFADYKNDDWSKAGLSEKHQMIVWLNNIDNYQKTPLNSRITEIIGKIADLQKQQQSVEDELAFADLFNSLPTNMDFTVKHDQTALKQISPKIFQRLQIGLINISDKKYSTKNEPSKKSIVKKSVGTDESEIASFSVNPEEVSSSILYKSPYILSHKEALAPGVLLLRDSESPQNQAFLPLSPVSLTFEKKPGDLNFETPLHIELDYKYLVNEPLDVDVKVLITPNNESKDWKVSERRSLTNTPPPKNDKNANQEVKDVPIEDVYTVSGFRPHHSKKDRAQFQIIVTRNEGKLTVKSTPVKLILYQDNGDQELKDIKLIPNTLFNFAEITEYLKKHKVDLTDKNKVAEELNIKSARDKRDAAEIKIKDIDEDRDNDRKKKVENERNKEVEKRDRYNQLIELDKKWPVGFYADKYTENMQKEIHDQFKNYTITLTVSRKIDYKTGNDIKTITIPLYQF